MMKKLGVIIYLVILLITLFALPFSSAEELLQNKTISESINIPWTIPPDPLEKILSDAGLDDFTIKRVKGLLTYAYGEASSMITDWLRDKTAEKLLKLFPENEALIKKVNRIATISLALKEAGDAYIDFYAANHNPGLSSYDRLSACIKLAEKGSVAIASFMPPGVSEAGVGAVKMYYLKVQYDVGEEHAAHLREKEELEKSVRDVQKTMYNTFVEYGTTMANKQIIVDVMSDDQIVNHVLGTTTGPEGESLQTEPDPSILDFVSPERRKEIEKEMKKRRMSERITSKATLDTQATTELENKYPVGSGIMIKMSPVYMLVIDPLGRKFGIDPETRDVICESIAVFCSPLLTHYDPQMVTTPALYEGTYEVKLFGIDDGKFVLSFMGLNNNYKVESNQDIEGYIKRGQILSATFDVERTEEGFTVSEIKFKDAGTFIPSSKAAEVPFKVVSIFPEGENIFRTEKPVIKIGFNKPLAENNDLHILKNSDGKKVKGLALLEGTHLTFIPAKPLDAGNYFIEVKDQSDAYGIKLSNAMQANFTIVRHKEDELKFSLSSPVIYNITTFLKVKNDGNSKITDIEVKDTLFQDAYPNVFVKYVGASIEPEISKDAFGNLWGTWKIGSLAPKEEKIISYTFLVFAFDVDYFDYVDFESISDSETKEDFLQPSDCIESDEEAIKKTAKEIIKSPANAYEKAQKTYVWLIKNIDYLYEGEGEPGGALQTLNIKKGVCYSYACLYAAFLRTLGVPTKYLTVASLSENRIERHAANEFFLQGYDWLPVDATWGKEVNDWFLSSGTNHIRLAEEKPPITKWSSYKGSGNLEVTFGDGTFETLEPWVLWNEDLKILYDSVNSIAFKKDFLDLLKESNPIVNVSQGLFDVEYVYYDRPFSELSNTLDSELLTVQNAIKQYFKSGVIEPKIKEDLERNNYLVYSKIIAEVKQLVDESEQELYKISERNKKYYESDIERLEEEFKSKGFDVTTESNYSEEIKISLWSLESLIPLPEAMAEIREFLVLSEKHLKQKDYDAVRENLLGIAGYLSVLDQTKLMLETESLVREKLTFEEVTSILDTLGVDFESGQGKQPNVILVGICGILFFLILPIFWIWMWINCLIRKEFRHLNKVLWFLIVFFGYIFFPLGAIIYFIIEYKKRVNKK